MPPRHPAPRARMSGLLGACVVAVLVAATAVASGSGPWEAGRLTPVAADQSAGNDVRSVTAAPPRPTFVTRPAWTRASVATVWLRPGKARPVDRPALRPTPDIDRWVHRQSLAQREDLTSRVLTQSVRGDRVQVLAERDRWSRVRLPQQRGSYFRHGIVGWVPSRQLSARAVRTTATTVSRSHD